MKGFYTGVANGVFVCALTNAAVCGAHNPALAEEATRPAALLVSRVATDGDFVTLPVKVDDEWCVFVVDTGSPTTTLDARFRDRLSPAGDKEKARAVAYKDLPELYLPPRMLVAGTESGSIPFPGACAVSCRDLTWLREASNFSIAGLICMDFLESYALQLDLCAGLLSFLRAESLRKNRQQTAIRMEIHHRRPCAEIESDDLVFWALIDTGALLSVSIQTGYGDNVYEYLVARRQIREVTSEVEVAGRRTAVVAPLGWLRELKFGPFTHRHLFVDPDDVSLLGLYYWRRYKCIFDFPGKTIYLDKSPSFDAPDHSDHAGIYLEPVAPALAKRVTNVAKDSLGDRLGIRRGDYLLAIDGKPAGRESVHTIYRRLTFRPDREMELVFRRYGEEFRAIIPPSATPVQR